MPKLVFQSEAPPRVLCICIGSTQDLYSKPVSQRNPLASLHQEWRLDPLDLLVTLQHNMWHWLPGAAAVLQQPHAEARGPRVRGPEPRGKVCARWPPALAPQAFILVWSAVVLYLGSLSMASLLTQWNPLLFNTTTPGWSPLLIVSAGQFQGTRNQGLQAPLC